MTHQESLTRLHVRLRSLLVGAFATGMDLAILALAVNAFGWSARMANVPALLSGSILQFLGNKWIAFDNHSGRWGTQLASFFAVEGLGVAVNGFLFDILVGGFRVPYVMARLVASSLVYFGVCLPLWARIFATTPSGNRT